MRWRFLICIERDKITITFRDGAGVTTERLSRDDARALQASLGEALGRLEVGAQAQ